MFHPWLSLLLLIGLTLPALAADAPKKLLLISQGPDGHPPGTHEFDAGQRILGQLLAKVPGLEITTAKSEGAWAEGPELIAKADGVVMFLSEGGKWMNADPRRKEALVRLAERGGGIAGIHWAIGTKEAENIDICLTLLGACHGGPDRKYKVFAPLVAVADKDHPIMAGIKDFVIHDEFYYRLKRRPDVTGFTPLLQIDVDGSKETVCWAWERPDKGRSFGFSGGHFLDHWRSPQYQRLFAQAILWTLGLEPPAKDFPAPLDAEEPLVRVSGQINDRDTGQPVAARVYIQGDSGRWFFPKSASAEGTAVVFQRERPDTRSVEMHTTLSAHPFTIDLPRGKYTLTVERGKEYLPVSKQFTLDKEPLDLAVEIGRWIDMKARGWYSGDTHIHHDLQNVQNLIMAEDVNIAFPLTYWVTTAEANPLKDNRSKSQNVKPEVMQVDESHLIYPLNTEYEIFSVGGKQHTLGAFLLLGHKTPFDRTVLPLTPIAERTHAEGGLIDLEKHSWPWSVSIVPLMKVDLFELANNHCWRTEFGFPQWTIAAAGEYMHLEKDDRGFTEWGWIDFGFKTYYALLNCGYRLQPTAGTAAGVHPVPLGFGRVYVHQPDGFTYANWLKGLKAGRSFVTTGPMLDVVVRKHVMNHRSGHVFAEAKSGDRYEVNGAISSSAPIDRVEFIVNGKIDHAISGASRQVASGGYEMLFEDAVKIDGSSWVAVRCFETHPQNRIRFAHTAPWHFGVAGKPLLPRQEEIDYLRQRCREEIERNRAVVGPEAIKEYEQALAAYEEIAKKLKAD